MATGDNTTGAHGSDAVRKQADDILSSAAAERASSEKIQSLDRSPQRGALVRGRRESGGSPAAKTTSPGHTGVTVDDSHRNMEVRSGSPEKKVHGPTTIRSPVQVTSDGDVVTVDHVSVISRGGETKHTRLPVSGRRRASGHVSDSASRQDRKNDRHSHTSASGTRRSGYVSDTSFSAVVHNVNDSLRSTATEGA